MPEIAKLTRHLEGVSLSVTLDDAPTVAHDRNPDRLDQLREAFQRIGIDHCTAFVIGETAVDNEDVLERWLDAGYTLGNHTFRHRKASDSSPSEFVADVERCDAFLQQLGAFADGRPKLFRFPFLDRGSRAHRETIDTAIRDLGYGIAHASIDWFDYRFDSLWHEVLAAGEVDDAAAIEDRHVMAGLRTTLYEVRRGRAIVDHEPAHIAYAHCNETTARCLPQLLIALRESGVKFVSAEDALRDDIFTSFDRKPLPTGRVLQAMATRDWRERLHRKLAQWSANLGLFRQRRLGPLWPYFE